MPSVTVPGTNGSTITEVYGNPNSARLAQQISDALGAALSAHSLLVTAAPNPGFTIPAPTTNPGGIDELVISAGGVYSIPAATGGGRPTTWSFSTIPPRSRSSVDQTTLSWAAAGRSRSSIPPQWWCLRVTATQLLY